MKTVYLLIIDNGLKYNINNLVYVFTNNYKKKILCFEKKQDLENYIKGMNKNDYLVKEINLINKKFLNSKL